MQKRQGISLIVLVITIIVMVILAAAIVISLSNSGIIERAQNAVDTTNMKTVQEMADLAWADGFAGGLRTQEALESYVLTSLVNSNVDLSKYSIIVTTSGTVVTSGSTNVAIGNWRYQKDSNGKYTLVTDGTMTLGIGDTINYTATGTEYEGDWQVLGANSNGELMIVSAESVDTVTLGSDDDLEDAQSDWVNAESILDTACEAYGNGYGASSITSARSIKIEDVNKLTGYNPLNTGVYDPDQTVTNGTKYREYVEDVFEIEYNKAYTYNEGIFYNGSSWVEASSESPVTMTNKYYWYYPQTLTNDENDTVVLDPSDPILYKLGMMLVSSSYCLASPVVGADSNIADFCVFVVSGGLVGGSDLVYSDGGFDSFGCGLRAVVSLASDIQLTGSSTAGWSIE